MKEKEFTELEKSQSGRMLEILTEWLDTKFTIPGTDIRFGLDAIIGIIPGGGNIMTTVISLGLLGFILLRGITFLTALKMCGNILLDFLFSSIPLIGVIFDVGYKSNLRNIQLLEKHLEKREPGTYYYGVWILFGILLLILIALSILLLYYLGVLLNYLAGA